MLLLLLSLWFEVKMLCNLCEYEWESRVSNPKACPRCKRRFDYTAVRSKEAAAVEA